VNSTDTTATINGKATTLPLPCTIVQMLQKLEMKPRGIAVEVDGELISHDKFETFCISEGSSIEIVTFVGGG
jgi:sulfur carrier protein